jgi:hypothetical protein
MAHAVLWVRWTYFMAGTMWFDGVAATLLVAGVLIGTPCSVFLLRQKRPVKRVVGATGVIYFAYYILRAVAES